MTCHTRRAIAKQLLTQRAPHTIGDDGCITALCVEKLPSRLPGSLSALIAAAMLFLLMLLKANEFKSYILFLALSALLIASLALSRNGPLHRILRSSSLVWLGSISYSLYMSHAAVELIANQAIRFLARAPEATIHARSVPQLSPTCAAIACVITVGVALLVSHYTHRYIEEPLRNRSRMTVGEQPFTST